MPSWLSLITSLTPRSPRRFRLRRNSIQNGSASLAPTRKDVIRGMSAGADGYVTKPFGADSLSRAVRTVLGVPVHEGGRRDVWSNPDTKEPRG